MRLLANGLMIATLLGMAACDGGDGAEPGDQSGDPAAAEEQASDVLAQQAPGRPKFPGFDGDGGRPQFPGFPSDGKLPNGESIKDFLDKLRDGGFPGFPGLPEGESIEDIINKLRDGGIRPPRFPGRGGAPGDKPSADGT